MSNINSNLNKIKIKGLGNVVLLDQNPVPEKEYLICIKAELRKIEKDISDKDNPVYTFIMEYLATENITEIGTARHLQVQKGKTPSQVLRWILEDEARMKGVDPEEYYKAEMAKIIEERKLKNS